jgi:hypothetical protein
VAAKRRAALGLSVRTGRAIVVVVGGSNDDPESLGKTLVQVAWTFEEGAVFHTAQTLPPERARAFVRDSEKRFTKSAGAELLEFTRELDARLVGARMAAPAEKQLPPLEAILKAHPVIHAAEGELYRRVFGEAAAAALGLRPLRVPPNTLGVRLAAALRVTPAKLATRLATLGKASGKPWAAHQKLAALAAWLALVEA